jgi:diacylglycerol kinase family enzyme
LRHVFGVIRGTHLGYRDIVYVKAGEIEVSGTAHIQIDGDYFGVTPAKISVVKDALKLVC